MLKSGRRTRYVVGEEHQQRRKMKYLILKRIILLGLLLWSCKIQAQIIDTNKLILNSKMRLTEYLCELENLEYYKSFLNYVPNYQFIASKGFDSSFVFFVLKIKPTIAEILESGEENGVIKEYFGNINHDFFFAYEKNSKKLLLLDFDKLDNFGELLRLVKIDFQISSGKVFTDEIFLKTYFIDGLDLAGLYKCFYKKAGKNCSCPHKKSIYILR